MGARSWDPHGICILHPFFVDVGQEGTFPSFDVRLNDTIVRNVVSSIVDLLATFSFRSELEVRLEFKSTRQLVINDDLAHTQHCFVNLRVVLKEGLGGFKVTDALVDMEFVEEGLKGGETVLPDSLTLDIHGEHIFALGSLVELDVDQLGVALTDGSEDDPGGPYMRLAPDILLNVVVH